MWDQEGRGMGVKKREELLCKVAWLFANGKAKKDLLTKAAILYAASKTKARDCRDRWKLKKRLSSEQT